MEEVSRPPMGMCKECGEGHEIWPELVRGTAECRCGSRSFTVVTADEYDRIQGAQEHRQPLDTLPE